MTGRSTSSREAATTNAETLPFITVAMPVYNERDHLEACLRSLLDQHYPTERVEIIVADGRSTDGSRAIADRMAALDPRVIVIDNPRRAKPMAMNLCIKEARGELVVWVGAHAYYSPDYLDQLQRAMVEYGADVVGGGVRTVSRATTPLGNAIAVCGGSRLGLAVAAFRAGSSHAQEANAVFGGCFRRSLFDEVGLLDERLDRGQDREFYQRLRRAGRKIMYVPEIQCTYYQRSKGSGYMAWLFYCGMTPFYISRITGTRNYVFRNLVPPAFVAVLLLLPLAAFAMPAALFVWLGIVAVYVLAVVIAGVSARRQLSGGMAAVLLLPVFLLTHIAYGLGSWYGMIKPIRRAQPWARA